MPSKTVAVATAGCTLALCLGFLWCSLRFAHKAEASLSAATQKLSLLDESVAQAKKRMAARQRDAAALQSELQRAQAIVTASRPASAKDPAILLVSDPNLRDLYLRKFRANQRWHYGAIYEIFGMSPAQIDKFEELATADQIDRSDIRATASAQGLGPDDPDISSLLRQDEEKFNMAVASEVGADVARQLNQFVRLEPGQEFVNAAADLVPTGSPRLTNSQAAQLIQILAYSSDNYQSGGKIDLTAVDWDKATAQAASILTSPQLEAFNAERQLNRVVGMVNQYFAQHYEPK
jgi:hypothetical protein